MGWGLNIPWFHFLFVPICVFFFCSFLVFDWVQSRMAGMVSVVLMSFSALLRISYLIIESKKSILQNISTSTERPRLVSPRNLLVPVWIPMDNHKMDSVFGVV